MKFTRFAAATAAVLTAATVGVVVPSALPARADTSVPTLPTNCSQDGAGGYVTCTYASTGAEQTLTLPVGVGSTSINVDLIGAAGAAGSPGTGSRGGEVDGVVTGLTSGATLYVEVGGTATVRSDDCNQVNCLGGFNGGGNGSQDAGGGGGATDIRTTSNTTPLTTSDTRVAIAGGGGGGGFLGAGCSGFAGDGGWGSGYDGDNSSTCRSDTGGGGGGGGEAMQGGAFGVGSGTVNGAQGSLGTGGDADRAGGGGGGGGLYGGGSGGGSRVQSATDPTATSVGNSGGGGGGSSMVGGKIQNYGTSTKAASATIMYGPGTAEYLALSPANDSVTALSQVTYTADGLDSTGADTGPVTGLTVTDTPANSPVAVPCPNATCTAVPGAQTITATSGNLTATTSLNGGGVPLLVATQLAVSVSPASAIAGSSEDVTVTAEDSDGDPAPTYTGTVNFTSTDTGGQTMLPPSYTFGAGDGGTHTFTAGATLTTAGMQTITATDMATPSITGTSNPVAITAGPATGLVVSPASQSVPVGTSVSYTSSELDSYGNTVNDPSLSPTYSSGDSGASCDGSSCTPLSAGDHSITASYTPPNAATPLTGTAVLTGTTATATQLAVSGPATAAAGTPVNVTVTAEDSNMNPTAYTGTAQLSSSDPQAQLQNDDGTLTPLPVNYTFTDADTAAGGHTFSIVFETAGSPTVSATDAFNSSITGVSTGILVSPGPAASLSLTPDIVSDPVGQSIQYSAEAYDAYGNDIGDVTNHSLFSIDPDGDCQDNVCAPLVPGVHTVTASYGVRGKARGTAELDATQGQPLAGSGAPPAAGSSPTPAPTPTPTAAPTSGSPLAGSSAPTPAPVPVVVSPELHGCTLSLARSVLSINYGDSVTVSGALKCATQPVSGLPVLVQGTYAGDHPKPLSTVITDATGHWSFKTKPAFNTVITASTLGLFVSAKVGVKETYQHLKVTLSGNRVTIAAELHPGYVPTRTSTLLVVVSAIRGRTVLTHRFRLTGLKRLNKRGVVHGYIPIRVSFTLPTGLYRFSLTASGTPASTKAATTAFRSVRVI